MIYNALTGAPKAKPKYLVQQQSDFTAEGAPPPVSPLSNSGAKVSHLPAKPAPAALG